MQVGCDEHVETLWFQHHARGNRIDQFPVTAPKFAAFLKATATANQQDRRDVFKHVVEHGSGDGGVGVAGTLEIRRHLQRMDEVRRAVSGPAKDQRGSFIELSWGGAEPLPLGDGSTRTFLEDGDVVTITATAPGTGGGRICFGADESRYDAIDSTRDHTGGASGGSPGTSGLNITQWVCARGRRKTA